MWTGRRNESHVDVALQNTNKYPIIAFQQHANEKNSLELT
jgi:hypothetical protein